MLYEHLGGKHMKIYNCSGEMKRCITNCDSFINEEGCYYGRCASKDYVLIENTNEKPIFTIDNDSEFVLDCTQNNTCNSLCNNYSCSENNSCFNFNGESRTNTNQCQSSISYNNRCSRPYCCHRRCCCGCI